MGKQTLIALDTDHIKQYVFATDRLKDIRGASSRLDHLNRRTMLDLANKFGTKEVYANGGSGMFLIEGDHDKAERLGQQIQREYIEQTKGGATISFAVQELPEGIDPWNDNTGEMQKILELLNLRLLTAKVHPQETRVLPSHPFMRPCDSCGTQYAENRDVGENDNLDEQRKRYCEACRTKRVEDSRVRRGINTIIDERNTEQVKHADRHSYIWGKIISGLPLEYQIPPNTERPSDFNELRNIAGGKDYLGLIYADGNNMGKIMGGLQNLAERQKTAETIDNAIFKALSVAINTHLKVIQGSKPMFPFDVLMVGGDDIVIVTPAAVALDVALTIAKIFQKETPGYTLSVGVVLAPIKYPFGLLQDLAESTLKHAKKEGAKKQASSEQNQQGASYINFLVVAGSTSHDFQQVYSSLHKKHVPVSGKQGDADFYATLRPYTPEDLHSLLNTIREGKRLSLGRTKLHQMREAVLQMNLTTSVSTSLAVLRNWRTRQQDFVLGQLFTLGDPRKKHSIEDDPASWFPRVTFPWFVDRDGSYRTSLLDIVELYDFVMLEGGSSDDAN